MAEYVATTLFCAGCLAQRKWQWPVLGCARYSSSCFSSVQVQFLECGWRQWYCNRLLRQGVHKLFQAVGFDLGLKGIFHWIKETDTRIYSSPFWVFIAVPQAEDTSMLQLPPMAVWLSIPLCGRDGGCPAWLLEHWSRRKILETLLLPTPLLSHKAWCLGKAKHGADGEKALKQQWGAAQNWLVEWCGFSQAKATTVHRCGQMLSMEQGAGRGAEEWVLMLSLLLPGTRASAAALPRDGTLPEAGSFLLCPYPAPQLSLHHLEMKVQM